MRPWLEAALALDPTDSIEDVRAGIERGELVLLTTQNAAGVGQINQHPRSRDFDVWLAGGDLSDLRTLEANACSLARMHGCDRITLSGRRGWLRALDGYEELNTAMAKALT